MSRNFSNASAPSTIKARASVGPGGVRGSYEGTVSSVVPLSASRLQSGCSYCPKSGRSWERPGLRTRNRKA